MSPKHRQMLREIMSLAIKHLSGASSYIEKRGLTDAIDPFQMGYIPSLQSIYDCLQENGWEAEEALEIASELGILFKKDTLDYGSFLPRRLIFPIYDTYGRIIGLAGRTLTDAKPKYYNTIFKKGDYLFGSHKAAKTITEKNYVVIVEGYTCVMSSHLLGFENIVATMGTALTKHHTIALSRYTQNGFLLYDADAAGKASAERYMEKKAMSPLLLKVTPISLPDKRFKDLHDLIQAEPQKALNFLQNLGKKHVR